MNPKKPNQLSMKLTNTERTTPRPEEDMGKLRSFIRTSFTRKNSNYIDLNYSPAVFNETLTQLRNSNKSKSSLNEEILGNDTCMIIFLKKSLKIFQSFLQLLLKEILENCKDLI